MKIRNKLYEAVGEGDVESLRELLDISNQKEHYGELLSIAVTHNFLEIVTLLLEHQANPNHITSEKSKETLLFSAVRSCTVPLITKLLEYKADINKQNDDGKTVLHCKVNVADLALVKLLLEHQANPNIQDNRGNTPILYTKFDTMFRLLLEHNADIDLQNKAGDSIRSILEDPTLSKYNSHLSKLLNDYLIEQLQNIKVADEGVVVTELGSVNICE